ncbi:MAG: hypothetical protein D6706_21875 [Chloroflexi bacterium]|nr:MAG: hypothetical protein D6706_21875 [Chloroflexota bacterium]
MAFYRILSLDGGGIRGLLTAILLDRLAEWEPAYMSRVDLFAGTSTGGILALAFAAGFTPREVYEMYEQSGTAVFADTPASPNRKRGETAAWYTNHNLKRALQSVFGERTLGDLPRHVLVAAFDLDNEATGPGSFRTWKPKFFHNFPGPDSDKDELIVDVALRTSAAPIFFPIYQGYVDGGIFAKNPAMCALAQAIHPETGGQRLEDVILLSVGTGQNAQFLALAPDDDGDWGVVQWSQDMRLLNVTMGNDVSLVDFQCRQFLGERYFRLDPMLSEVVHLDGMAELRRLVSVAWQTDLRAAGAWLQQYFGS